LPSNAGGFAVIKKPWPAMMRTIYKDPDRYKVYWNTIPNCYTAGDVCRKDQDGYLWFMGRADDVIKVAGNRIGTAEVESALVKHPTVAEAAVVGRPDDLTGEAVVAFVTLKTGSAHTATPEMKTELRDHVSKMIGSIARPAEVRFADVLPKTRSGKIMRRLLRDIATGKEVVQDTSTLEDLSVLARLRAATGDEE
jgi:acetyl-CoA synthetase